MHMKLSRRFAFAVLLALLGALALAVAVGAHAQLIRSEPAANAVLATAPGQVKLFYDEAVNVSFSRVQVLDQAQARVDNDDLKLSPGDAKQLVVTLKPLPDGTYTVVWQVLSDTDGHVTNGNFAFSVGSGTGAAPALAPTPVVPQAGVTETAPLSVAVRWLSLLALLALVGGFFFREILLERSLRAVPIPAGAQDRLRARWRQLAWTALILALVAYGASLPVEASLAGNVPLGDLAAGSAVARTLLDTRFGALWIARMVLLLAAGLALAADWKLRAARPAALALSVGALLTVSLGGHSAAVDGGFSAALLFDWLHLICVSLWVGGLFHFLAALMTLWRAAPAETGTPWLAWMVPHFSTIALPSAAMIALTGLYNSLLQVPTLEALVSTAYGATLAVKVALFDLMIALGAINWLFISPRLRRAARAVPAEPAPRLASGFRLTVAAEVLLGVGAIFLAGLLTLEPPARSLAQNPPAPVAILGPQQPAATVLRGSAAPDVQVALTLKPATETPGDFDVYLTDLRSNAPITNTLRVMLQFTLLDQDVGVTTQIAPSKGDGHYVTQGNFITLPGLWRLRVVVRRAGVEDVSAEFPFYRSADSASDTHGDPQAIQWLRQSDEAMNQLHSLRSVQALTDGAGGLLVTEFEYRAPDAVHLTSQTGEESIALGPVQYDRDQSGQWTQRQRAEPFVFPKFDMAGQATNAQLGRQETLNGEPAQVVRFKLPDVTRSGFQYAEWISTKDQRLLQLAMAAPSHYMMQTYTDYDSPQISVAAPANVRAPTPAPAIAAPNAPAPVGLPFIAGDFEKYGAFALLIGSVIIGWFASDRKRPRTRRLVLLSVGLLAVLVSVGLFVHATVANMAVDTSMAALGKPLYETHCVVCHGATGHGDGPAAKSLPVTPFDLTVHVPQHDEAFLKTVIADGWGSMPAFKDKLTQDQIYQVIAYARLLAAQAQLGAAQPTSTPGP
jgi:copper transport protein